MLRNPDYKTARELLMTCVTTVEYETVLLTDCGGRILAEDLKATENIPPFDRSPYDGYAFRAVDTANASKEHPVTLKILEEVPAGAMPTVEVTAGTAVKILTGAQIPVGADVIEKFEDTEFTESEVTLFASYKSGKNIVRIGEDVKKGQILAKKGDVIDPGIAGTLASQGVTEPLVYRIPKIGILSTGSELVEADESPGPGKIRNSNRHTLETVLKIMGCDPIYLGTAGDDVDEIVGLLKKGLETCDAVISTGGVSVGDYDLTPDAMVRAGVEILFEGTDMKPGMASAYGVKDGKIICGLSGNPASSLMNFYAVVYPALRKLQGFGEALPQEITVTLADEFKKKSPVTRFLRGTLALKDGVVRMELPKDQGNMVLSSVIGCNVMAVVPAGSGPVPAGTVLKGFII